MRISDLSSDVCSSDLDEDRAIFGLGHVFLDRDRLESRCRLQVAIDPLHRVAIEPEQRLELPEHQLLIVQAVGNKIDAERNAIVGERLADRKSTRLNSSH